MLSNRLNEQLAKDRSALTQPTHNMKTPTSSGAGTREAFLAPHVGRYDVVDTTGVGLPSLS